MDANAFCILDMVLGVVVLVIMVRRK